MDRTKLFQEMLKITLRELENYQTDLIYDFKRLNAEADAETEAQTRTKSFCWLTRKTGTYLCEIYENDMIENYKKYSENCYIIKFEKNGCVETWSIEKREV